MNRKLNFIVAEEPRAWRTHHLAELGEYLTALVLEPMFAAAGHRWNRRFLNVISVDDAGDSLASTGTLLVRVPPLFAGRAHELEAALRAELSTLGIVAGPARFAADPRHPGRETISIPIVENPTVLVSPPEVNIGYHRGSIVMRDLLGYQPANGRFEFAAGDLLQRVSAVSEEKIAACSAGPMAGPEGVRRRPSAITMKSFQRCLEEIRQFAIWATRNNHEFLAAT